MIDLRYITSSKYKHFLAFVNYPELFIHKGFKLSISNLRCVMIEGTL